MPMLLLTVSKGRKNFPTRVSDEKASVEKSGKYFM